MRFGCPPAMLQSDILLFDVSDGYRCFNNEELNGVILLRYRSISCDRSINVLYYIGGGCKTPRNYIVKRLEKWIQCAPYFYLVLSLIYSLWLCRTRRRREGSARMTSWAFGNFWNKAAALPCTYLSSRLSLPLFSQRDFSYMGKRAF